MEEIPKEDSREPGGLFVVATPIGNLADISLRALEVLRSVDAIAAEDTRHTRKLLSRYEIHRPTVSYHRHNAARRGPELLRRIGGGERIALVTDAGMPSISDPGAALVSAVLEADLPLEVIPGPTALIVALVSSGLPTQPFAFLGFAPARGRERRRFFADHAPLAMTRVLYEAPHRLLRTLADLLEQWGDRRLAVARELTKKHEETFRGTVSEALERYREGVRGEVTLVVEGAAPEDAAANAPEWREELARLILEDQTGVRAATDRTVERYGLPRKMVYREALEIKNRGA